MKEPILSLEEVRAIFMAHGFTIKEGQTDLKQYVYDAAAALESALLEKLCGEPVAWRAPNLSGSGDTWAYRDADDRLEDQHGEPVGEPLYALNGSKA